MSGQVRYGVELEGPYKGLPTLVLLSAAHHSLELVERLRQQHPDRPVVHLWVQCAPGERYDWDEVWRLAAAGYSVTAQLRDTPDLPPARLTTRTSGVAFSWRIPDTMAPLARLADVATVFGPGGPFDGQETPLNWRRFDAREYEKDEVWNV